MKKSIAKHVIRNMGLFVIATLVATFFVVYFQVKNAVVNNEIQFLQWTEDIIWLSTKRYMVNSDLSFYDPGFAEEYTEKYSELCDRYGLDYIYIYKPDLDKKELTYSLLAGSKECRDKIAENSLYNPVSTRFNKENAEVWNNEYNYVYTEMNNRYGYEIGMLTLIEDEAGNRAILGIDRSVEEIVHKYIRRILVWCSIELLGFTLIFWYMYKTFLNKIMVPVNKISAVMNDFVSSDCHTEIGMQENEYAEFQMISSSFNRMAKEIHNYITDIMDLTKEKERVKTELQVSEQIQKGLLPEPLYKTPSFEICAMMKTAKQVGGDLYDYLNIDKDNVLLVIADVSGKGVSAGIFMSMTLAIIRQLAGIGKSPAEIMTLVNRTISKNNPRGMFVTAFVALYNKLSCQLSYADAGHNMSYILRNGKLIKLDKCHGAPLGLFDDEVYEQSDIQLLPSDILYTYTDGVTEAINENKKFYGLERLEATLCGFTKTDETSIIEEVCDSLQDFCGVAEQNDDITMLALTMNNRCELLLDADEMQFARIREFIMHSAIPKQFKLKLCLACEEWFVNICMYTYDQAAVEKKVKFTCDVSDSVTIVFEDWGKQYNPLEKVITKEEYDLDNQIGGLGKLIIVNFADKVDYSYEDGRNIFTIIKNIHNN